mgnify:CR=1 FL=1
MDRSVQIDTFTRFTQVSRETITSLIKYENKLITANKKLNLIGNSTIDQIWIRHFLDSAQLIDLIDKNHKTLTDLGTGAGFPGLILSILAKDRKIPLKIQLIEKSPKKVLFLKDIINSFELDAEVQEQNILKSINKFNVDLIAARAFKPLKIILEFLNKKTVNWNKIFLFLGKTGQNELIQASKNWHIKYKQRMSVTSSDSLIITIKKIRKK